MASAFDPAHFAAICAARRLTLGQPCHALAVTGSTNDDALRAARAGAAQGTVFVAEQQTAGRGRRGNAWFARSGESLLCSVVMRSRLAAENVPLLALVAGLAIRSAIERALVTHGAQHANAVRVKWPNDVWVDGKKIAGVLAEAQLRGSQVLAEVIGFGINVTTETFPETLAGRVTSLGLLGVEVAREVLLADVLEALAERTDALCRDGVSSFSAELSRSDALLGRRVRLAAWGEGDGGDGHDATLEGTALGIDGAGCLILRDETARILHVRGGAVEVVD
jgi:BirA family biotin operon repressor/biotin-[acetyl-CoA-carboxylase] ligase